MTLKDAVTERESERYARLRSRREEALTRAYRETLESIGELDEITENLHETVKKLTFLQRPAGKVAAVIAALGGGAGLAALAKALLELLT